MRMQSRGRCPQHVPANAIQIHPGIVTPGSGIFRQGEAVPTCLHRHGIVVDEAKVGWRDLAGRRRRGLRFGAADETGQQCSRKHLHAINLSATVLPAKTRRPCMRAHGPDRALPLLLERRPPQRRSKCLSQIAQLPHGRVEPRQAVFVRGMKHVVALTTQPQPPPDGEPAQQSQDDEGDRPTHAVQKGR
jgi:hypothetical protein